MIKVTDNYGLKLDNYNYQLMKYRGIDPTKSPKFEEGDDTKIRYEWKEENSYYPTSTTGLASALQEIAHREVKEKLGNTDVMISEYVAELRTMHRQLQEAVEQLTG